MKRIALAAATAAALLVGTAHAADITIYKQPHFQGKSYLINGEVANIEAGLASEGSSMKVTGGFWEVCTGDHFKGNCYVIAPGEYPRLRGLDDRIVSARFLGNDQRHAERAMAYYDERFAKREARREAREERREMREARREWRDNRAAAIDLYGGRDFRGRAVRVEDNTLDLIDRRFDGRASSAVVHEGTWQLCSEPGYRGRCAVLRPGEYSHLAMLDNRVSSLRQIH